MEKLTKNVMKFYALSLFVEISWFAALEYLGRPEDYLVAFNSLEKMNFISQSASPYILSLSVITLVMHIVGLVLLLKFKNIGRIIFNFTVILFIFLGIVYGYVIYEPIQDTLYFISSMLLGALILLINFTESKKLFS